jgi:hypothetical protein
VSAYGDIDTDVDSTSWSGKPVPRRRAATNPQTRLRGALGVSVAATPGQQGEIDTLGNGIASARLHGMPIA